MKEADAKSHTCFFHISTTTYFVHILYNTEPVITSEKIFFLHNIILIPILGFGTTIKSVVLGELLLNTENHNVTLTKGDRIMKISLKSIRLRNFRGYTDSLITFDSHMNVIIGIFL